jgi:hypothetical protein
MCIRCLFSSLKNLGVTPKDPAANAEESNGGENGVQLTSNKASAIF